MALIKCGECGKEISSNAKSCPNCGNSLKQRKFSFKSIILIIIILALISISVSIFYFISIRPKNMYNNALSMAEKGKYQDALNILNDIKNYDNVEKLGNQLKYESRVYTCISNLKEILKNPDSLQIYKVDFYVNPKLDNKIPICIINYGAQNGFGGNTTRYALFSSENKLTGTCDTLDSTDIDKEDFSDWLTCIAINTHYESSTKVGDIDLNRIKVLLKNDSYINVKIIN